MVSSKPKEILRKTWPPFAAILGGIAATIALAKWSSARSGAIEPGVTYAAWISELEVGGTHPDGRDWDIDGSAPDLMGKLKWRGLNTLSTETAKDSMVAKWSSGSVDVREIFLTGRMQGKEFGDAVLIKPESQDRLSALFYDEDLADKELLGGASWAITGMVEGANIFLPEPGKTSIKSFAICMVRADQGTEAKTKKMGPVHLYIGHDLQWIPPGKGSAEENVVKASGKIKKGGETIVEYLENKARDWQDGEKPPASAATPEATP